MGIIVGLARGSLRNGVEVAQQETAAPSRWTAADERRLATVFHHFMKNEVLLQEVPPRQAALKMQGHLEILQKATDWRCSARGRTDICLPDGRLPRSVALQACVPCLHSLLPPVHHSNAAGEGGRPLYSEMKQLLSRAPPPFA